MEKWKGKVALVTGASGGIGAAALIDLAKAGVITVGMARRPERIEDLKKTVPSDVAKNIHSIKGDVSDEASVADVFKWVKEKFGDVNILVNNAAVARAKMILSDDDSNEEYQTVINTNLLGLMYCTREAYKQLKESGDYGYIININSVAGHMVPIRPNMQPQSNLYAPSKFGVTALTEVVRQEIMYLQNKKVRITSISPGIVGTEFAVNSGLSKTVDYSKFPHLNAEDVSQAINYVLSTAPHVQVKELMIKPLFEAF